MASASVATAPQYQRLTFSFSSGERLVGHQVGIMVASPNGLLILLDGTTAATEFTRQSIRVGFP